MDLDLDPWITKIKTVPEIKKVEGAVELIAALKKKQTPDLSCFVVPVGDSGGDNQFGTGAFSQQVTERVGIVLAVKSRNDNLGKTAHGRLVTIRRKIKDALNNWLPDANENPAIFSRGRLVDFNDQVIWWQDEYTWQYEDRKI